VVRISAFLTLAVSLWLPTVASAQADPKTALLEEITLSPARAAGALFADFAASLELRAP
jgi:hypothetical protein